MVGIRCLEALRDVQEDAAAEIVILRHDERVARIGVRNRRRVLVEDVRHTGPEGPVISVVLGREGVVDRLFRVPLVANRNAVQRRREVLGVTLGLIRLADIVDAPEEAPRRIGVEVEVDVAGRLRLTIFPVGVLDRAVFQRDTIRFELVGGLRLYCTIGDVGS